MPVTRLILVGAAAAAVTAAGCQGVTKAKETTYHRLRSLITDTYKDPRADDKLASADALYEAGDYKAAAAVYEDLADNTSNPTMMAEKARYQQAECLRQRNHLPDAAATYHRLLQDFPYGAYRERACSQMYAIAYGWLEKGTLVEIEQARTGVKPAWYQELPSDMNFTDPAKPLLDTEGEALKVLDNVQTHDGVGPNADRALFWLGYVHFYRGRFDEADHYFSQLVELHKDSKLRPVALDLAIIAKNNATGGPVYDVTKAAEALQLIHHAEATMPGYATDPVKAAEMSKRKAEVRFQLAQKYLRMAEYYERTHNPGSAYFYYDLVVRQHPGTKSAEVAKARMDALEPVRKQMDADRAAAALAGPKPPRLWRDPEGAVRYQFDKLTQRVTGAPAVAPADEEPGPWLPGAAPAAK